MAPIVFQLREGSVMELATLAKVLAEFQVGDSVFRKTLWLTPGERERLFGSEEVPHALGAFFVVQEALLQTGWSVGK